MNETVWFGFDNGNFTQGLDVYLEVVALVDSNPQKIPDKIYDEPYNEPLVNNKNGLEFEVFYTSGFPSTIDLAFGDMEFRLSVSWIF